MPPMWKWESIQQLEPALIANRKIQSRMKAFIWANAIGAPSREYHANKDHRSARLGSRRRPHA